MDVDRRQPEGPGIVRTAIRNLNTAVNIYKYGEKVYKAGGKYLKSKKRKRSSSSRPRAKATWRAHSSQKSKIGRNLVCRPHKLTKRQIEKNVAVLKSQLDADNGTHTDRNRQLTFMGETFHKMARYEGVVVDSVSIEAVLAKLQYYDPSNPGVLITAPGATGTFSKAFIFEKFHSTLRVICASTYPVKVRVYACKAKKDTNFSASGAWDAGLADVGLSGEGFNPMVYPTDSPVFNNLYSIAKSWSFKLFSGGERTLSFSTNCFEYDPSIQDSHTDAKQGVFNAWSWLVLIDGQPGLDSTDTTAATLAHGPKAVYIEQTDVAVVKYAAGANIKRYSISDDVNTTIPYANFRIPVVSEHIMQTYQTL